MRAVPALLVFIMVVATGCYNRHSLPSESSFAEAPNCTMADIRLLAEQGCTTITSDKVCVGRVTSTDVAQNFYRTLFIEDESGAVELLLGGYNMHSIYPLGLEVAVKLEGLAVALKDGVVQVGLPPESYDLTPREIGAQQLIAKHLVRGASLAPIEPFACDVESLDPSLCGRLVSLRNLLHSPIDEETEYFRYVDDNQQQICLYISQHSSLSAPDSLAALTGILSYCVIGGEEAYVLTPRFEDDFKSSCNSD